MTAQEYYNVQRQIRDQIRVSYDAGAASEQALIREEMNTLVASVEYDVAYADLQNAFASVYASVGVDPHGAGVSRQMPVAELAEQLRMEWNARGDLTQ